MHLRPILLWWLHLSIIRLTYLPDIIHIRNRIRSRGAVLSKESLRHRQVTGRVGIARCQVIGPKIVLSRRRNQMIIRKMW
jgi:hypothetical protein